MDANADDVRSAVLVWFRRFELGIDVVDTEDWIDLKDVLEDPFSVLPLPPHHTTQEPDWESLWENKHGERFRY